MGTMRCIHVDSPVIEIGPKLAIPRGPPVCFHIYLVQNITKITMPFLAKTNYTRNC